jgi:inner membrane protein COX18
MMMAVVQVVNSPAAHWIETSLASVHDTTGLPWWGTIVMSTALLRTSITLPAHITQHKVAAKRLILGQQMNTEILPELNKAVNQRVAAGKVTKEEAKQEFNRVAKMIHTEKVRGTNCHIFKLMTPMLIQVNGRGDIIKIQTLIRSLFG